MSNCVNAAHTWKCALCAAARPQTAAARGAEPLPVMVWLHGGGFMNGSGNVFNGGYLAQTAKVIFVTVNYRLNSLGRPALADEAPNGSAGKYGLLDDLQALRWVQENIATTARLTGFCWSVASSPY